jgi:hypothetical protein
VDAAALAALVATVPDQAAVFKADLAQASGATVSPAAEIVPEKTAQDVAIDGVAWHVFNTLRGAADDVNGATFEDIRAIVAQDKF